LRYTSIRRLAPVEIDLVAWPAVTHGSCKNCRAQWILIVGTPSGMSLGTGLATASLDFDRELER